LSTQNIKAHWPAEKKSDFGTFGKTKVHLQKVEIKKRKKEKTREGARDTHQIPQKKIYYKNKPNDI
jgi:hypothetical protein